MYIPLIKPEIGAEEISRVTETLNSKWLSTGPDVIEFEEKFAKYIGVNHAIAVNSGTSALELAISSLSLKDANITCPSFTFMAVPNAIVNSGLKPNFVDVLSLTHRINPDKIKIDKKTKAIIPVHTFGYPCNMKKIMDIATEYELLAIEDCAESCGASINGKKAGSFGDIGIFSFTASKNMTTGEGGMITTDNDDIASRIRLMRSHGNPLAPRNLPWIRNAILPGHNMRMSNILASIGIEQLAKLDQMNEKRIKNSEYLNDKLINTPHIQPPLCLDNGYRHVYQMYCIKLNNLPITRDEFVTELRKIGVSASVYFDPPCHQMKLYSSRKASLPITEEVSKSIVTLPMYPSLTKDEMSYMVECIEKIIGGTS